MIPMKWALCAIALLSVTARAQSIDLSRYPDAAASDPKAMGWMVGSPPPPDKTIRWRDGDHVLFPKLRWAVTHIRELQPTVNIARGTGSPATLSRAERRLDDVRYTDMNGVSRTWSEALAKTWSDGVIVLHRGRVVSEQYFGDLAPQRPHILFSVTKSFVGTLAAMLVNEKRLDETALVVRYVPELAGTAFADATVRQVMDMTTAFKYSEKYADPNAEIWDYMRSGGFLPAPPGTKVSDGYAGFLRTLRKEGEHDVGFTYRTPNTDVLSWVIQRVSGQSLQQMIEERLWRPLGAEQDAYMMMDHNGFAFGGGGLNMTLRDMARVGEMMRQGGRFNGRQIVPEAVVADIRRGADKAKFAKAGYATLPNWSYRNMWWVSDKGYYMARGVHGQAIFIDPVREVVIARFGSHPVSTNVAQDPIILPAYEAIAAHLAAGGS